MAENERIQWKMTGKAKKNYYSIDMVRSRKIHGKYIVKIVFQKKQHQTVWVRTGGCCVFLS